MLLRSLVDGCRIGRRRELLRPRIAKFVEPAGGTQSWKQATNSLAGYYGERVTDR
jgi:hypothetical protein